MGAGGVSLWLPACGVEGFVRKKKCERGGFRLYEANIVLELGQKLKKKKRDGEREGGACHISNAVI